MAKTIAVWGSPNSGKTTFATKLARAIYDGYQSTVIVVYTDMETPTLPILFPNEKSENMSSLGTSLAGADITQEKVIGQIMTVKGLVNFGFLGFKDGENHFTYPKFNEGKLIEFFRILDGLCNYVIVDCTSDLSNPISDIAIRGADEIIRLASPTLKSISYFSSQLPLYADPKYRLDEHIQGLNVPDADLYMPIEDAKAHLNGVRFTLPFSREVKQQMLDGKLYHTATDKRFNSRINAIAEKVV